MDAPLHSAPRRGRQPRIGRGQGQVTLPAYVHIVNTISERLASGSYDAGSQLPTESQFCKEFGVSHMTLRTALRILADRGLISPEQGRGTFVRSFDLSDSVFALRQLTGEWLEGSIKVRLLSAATTTANEQVARMLAISPGDRVVRLRHLALCDETPAVYHREYVLNEPHRPLVELAIEASPLHGLLEGPGSRKFPRGKVTLRASALGAAAARILGKPAGTSALCLEHLFQDAVCRPLSWGCFLLRADLFTLQACLGPEQTDTETRSEAMRSANSI
jgi:GntR family transcriptional regulator